jgi:transcriptional regulator with PAS, ATPase and Fis domain
MIMFPARAELFAHELISLIQIAHCAAAATVTRCKPNGSAERVASFGSMHKDVAIQTIHIREKNGDTISISLQPLPDLESRATLNAILLLLATLGDLERAHIEREERLTLWPIEELPTDDDDAVLLGKMRELMTFARKVARTNVSVLITGESGTGKEVLARAIHRFSTRADKPFIPVNCTAVPRELLESQLFGYRRGAFTGAERDSLGMIRTAKDGTLFLDEIGELGIDLQPKLLRFLECGEIAPLGEPSPLRVDVRILAATNANLEDLVQEHRFREDLFYRLNVIRLTIPPLRERRDEIPALVHHFMGKASTEFGKGRVRLSEDAMEHLLLYPWPGNVRQLHNELRRMVALAEPDTVLLPNALSLQILRATTPRASRRANGLEMAVPLEDKLNPTLSRIEREMIKLALHAHEGKVEAAAKALGISRKGLYLKRQRLGL